MNNECIGLDNYWFYYDLSDGCHIGKDVVYKIIGSSEQNGIIRLSMINENNENIDTSIPRRLADRFAVFKDGVVFDLVGKCIMISFDYEAYTASKKDVYFAVDDDEEIAVEVDSIDEVTENSLSFSFKK